MGKNKLSISINGRQYTVVSEMSSEYMRKLAEHVNEKVTFVKKNGSNVMGERPLVIAALNICDEYYNAEEAVQLIKTRMEKVNAQNDELIAENKRLQEMFDTNEFEIEMKTMQNKIDEYEKTVSEQKDKIRHLESSVEALKLKYEKDMASLRAGNANFSGQNSKKEHTR